MQVGVIGARNVLGKNSSGLSNPYCTAWVTNKGHKLKERTPVCRHAHIRVHTYGFLAASFSSTASTHHSTLACATILNVFQLDSEGTIIFTAPKQHGLCHHKPSCQIYGFVRMSHGECAQCLLTSLVEQVVHGNLSPVWESLFEFPISDSSATLSIYVWSQSSRFMRNK
jgi:hypothetical protein